MYLEFTQSGFPTMEIQLQNQTPAIGHTVWQCKLSRLKRQIWDDMEPIAISFY